MEKEKRRCVLEPRTSLPQPRPDDPHAEVLNLVDSCCVTLNQIASSHMRIH